MTIATSGFARFNCVRRATRSAAITVLSLILIVSRRSIEIVWTFAVLTGAFAAPLDGIIRFMLFSSSGVVIMKMISKTNARSSNGVMLISESVERLCRWE